MHACNTLSASAHVLFALELTVCRLRRLRRDFSVRIRELGLFRRSVTNIKSKVSFVFSRAEKLKVRICSSNRGAIGCNTDACSRASADIPAVYGTGSLATATSSCCNRQDVPTAQCGVPGGTL